MPSRKGRPESRSARRARDRCYVLASRVGAGLVSPPIPDELAIVVVVAVAVLVVFIIRVVIVTVILLQPLPWFLPWMLS